MPRSRGQAHAVASTSSGRRAKKGAAPMLSHAKSDDQFIEEFLKQPMEGSNPEGNNVHEAEQELVRNFSLDVENLTDSTSVDFTRLIASEEGEELHAKSPNNVNSVLHRNHDMGVLGSKVRKVQALHDPREVYPSSVVSNTTTFHMLQEAPVTALPVGVDRPKELSLPKENGAAVPQYHHLPPPEMDPSKNILPGFMEAKHEAHPISQEKIEGMMQTLRSPTLSSAWKYSAAGQQPRRQLVYPAENMVEHGPNPDAKPVPFLYPPETESMNYGIMSNDCNGQANGAYRRKACISMEVCQALERSKTEHVEYAAMRRAIRQRVHTEKAYHATLHQVQPTSAATGLITSQVAVEKLLQKVAHLDSEYRKMQVRLAFSRRLNHDQSTKIEDLERQMNKMERHRSPKSSRR